MRGHIGKNKKGMSLVELIAVMAISVVVVGAALLALYGGSRGATDGSADFANHGDAHLLETWLRNNMPTIMPPADGSKLVNGKIGSGANTYSLFFTDGGSFEIARDGKSVMQISGIQSFTVSTQNSGSDAKSNPGQNQTFQYTITTAGGGRSFVLSGGIVLNNVPAASDASKLAIPSEQTLTPSDPKKLFLIVLTAG